MYLPENLTADEVKAMEELRKRMEKEMTPKLLEDESVYYRFCKARDFKIEEAESMLRKHIAWRKEWQIDTILDDYEALEVCKYVPTGFVGFDKEGALLRYINMGNADSRGILNSMKKHDFLKYSFYLGEQDIEALNQRSIKLGKPFTQYIHIVDFGNMSFSQATHKKTIETLIQYLTMFQDNYPERIKCVYHINASIYYTMIMSVVKHVVALPLMQKLKIFGQGWKEELLKHVDEDVLPAFMGGKRTDPDGDPQCKTFITFPQKVPEESYLSNRKKELSKAPGARRMVVSRRSKETVSFEVQEPGSCLEWEFEITDWEKDIGFSVCKTNESKAVELLPKKRIDTCYGPEKGHLVCEKKGLYGIVFDNSYSWMYQKEIYYRARLRGPNDDEHLKWT
ncbi:hypothetical protein CDAR_566542 [Caerostris darwini]|uniref:SEC14-like protein 2 n=1 Tax=Caerostris darwini TaxID=1538125 RepID=A0AAV4X313_9ARAC|nr:hypothetical protein CDAR_566542 [Caerostris darwini]